MMIYLLLFIGLLLSSITAVFLKIYQNRFGIKAKPMFLFTLLMGVGIAVVMACMGGYVLKLCLTSLLFAIFMGVLYAVNMPLYQKALSTGGISICSVFLFLGGLLLPVLYGLVFLSEQLNIWKIFGILIIILAVFTQFDVKTKNNKNFFLYGIGIFLINGIFCICLKVQANLLANIFEVMFVAGLTLILISIVMIFIYRKEKLTVVSQKDIATGVASAIGYGLFNGIANFINIYVAGQFPATVQFPINSAGVIIITTLLGIYVFKEKLNRNRLLAIILSMIALLFYVIS